MDTYVRKVWLSRQREQQEQSTRCEQGSLPWFWLNKRCSEGKAGTEMPRDPEGLGCIREAETFYPSGDGELLKISEHGSDRIRVVC